MTPSPVTKRTPQEVMTLMHQEKVKWLDLQFVDLNGRLQHISIPSATVDDDAFKHGVGKLDGSSIRGFKAIHESDMLMKPDPDTFAVLPWGGGLNGHDFSNGNGNGNGHEGRKIARMLVDIYEGASNDRFTRDSRYIAERAQDQATAMGYDTTYWGPELEFFVFDAVKMLPNAEAVRNPSAGCGYEIVSDEAPWSNGDNHGKTVPIGFKEGYYPAPPADSLHDFRTEACNILQNDFNIVLDAHHHEVATAGQCEIDMRYAPMVAAADNSITYKFVMKLVAHKMGKIATFMPKPIFGDNASGMHVHQSLWTQGKNAMFDPDDPYAEISQTCRYYIGGLMEHARALCVFTNPSTNSYRRLVPGYEAPVFIAWSRRNRSANIRIPRYYKAIEKATRIEYRTPDPSANVYLCFSALLAAGLDGIKRKVDCGDPVDEDIYKLSRARRKELGVGELPGSLREAVDALEADREFLKPIFPDDLVEKYVELKVDEHIQTSLRPSPYEFYRYLDT